MTLQSQYCSGHYDLLRHRFFLPRGKLNLMTLKSCGLPLRMKVCLLTDQLDSQVVIAFENRVQPPELTSLPNYDCRSVQILCVPRKDTESLYFRLNINFGRDSRPVKMLQAIVPMGYSRKYPPSPPPPMDDIELGT